MSSAAVLTVYAAGYLRTRSASERLAAFSADRRRAAPLAISAAIQTAPAQPAGLALPTRPALSPRPAPAPLRIEAAAPISFPETSVRETVHTAAVQAPGTPAAVPTMAADAPAETSASSSTGTRPSAAPAAPVEPVLATSPAVAALPATQAVTNLAPDPAAVNVTTASAAKPRGQFKDGTYTGWGSCRHGDIQAAVVIADGRIASASIAQCLTRYSCSWIAALPGQVVKRQSPDVDYVSGATQSADAFYGAIVDALSKAK
jgi:uncharacterized protein with FMN-binding domain